MTSDATVSSPLPDYASFSSLLATIEFPFSASAIHGVICAFLCAGADALAETYLRVWLSKQQDEKHQQAFLALFAVFVISQQQIKEMDIAFKLLLPADEVPIAERAEAFCQWCKGFIEGLALAKVKNQPIEDEDVQAALEHLSAFAQLDYESLEDDEEAERAFLEVSEYTRMAVLHFRHELSAVKGDKTQTKH